MIKSSKKIIGVNTHRANRIVEHGLKIIYLKNLSQLKKKAEFRYSEDTRFDFYVTNIY